MSFIDFEFVGTISERLSVDPEEFTGMPVPEITEELTKLLAEIRPDANFFHDDVVLAA